MRHIIDAIAAQGRDGDSELLHVTKGELRGLDGLARRHFGRELPRNPRTGLKEASLFRDWFGNDVGMVMDVAAPVATAFIPGVGPVAAAAMGAGIGAANQGLGKGGTTESALMGGVMGGIGAYGGSGLAEGLGAATTAAPTGVTAGVTPIGEAGANIGAGTIADAGANLSTAATPAAETAATTTAESNLAQMAGQGQMQGQTAMQSMPNLSQNTSVAQGANMPGATAAPPPSTDAGLKWDYLTTKDALSPVTQIGTSAIGTAGIPGAPADTTPTTTSINSKPMPKAEVYYTPYGERRTRIAAAEGGLMSFNDYDAADADKDGGYAPGGIAGYDFGGMVKSIQPGGAWGDATANLYGAVDQSAPWLKDITPGGAVGQLQPGRRDWEEKKRQEEEAKVNEAKARDAAAAKAAKDVAFQQQWQDRYKMNMAQGGLASMAEGGYTGPRDGEAVSAIVRASQPKEENAFEHPMIRKIAGQNVTGADLNAWNSARQEPNAFEHPMIRRMAGQNITQDDLTSWNNRQRGYVEGGLASMAQGRYLQGPGDGMLDSIKANIDGKQEARLATGEFVVPADVVSHLGNGDSNAGAKQLHNMMDRARMTRTGTKKQGKQINPRKVMPT